MRTIKTIGIDRDSQQMEDNAPLIGSSLIREQITKCHNEEAHSTTRRLYNPRNCKMSYNPPQLTHQRDYDSVYENQARAVDSAKVTQRLEDKVNADFNSSSTKPSLLATTTASSKRSMSDDLVENPSLGDKIKLAETELKFTNETKGIKRDEHRGKRKKLSEAERQQKEDDRRKKEAEREKKREAIESEKQLREEKRRKIDEEKNRKNEEIRRKERSQLRLGSFFAAPGPVSSSLANLASPKVQASSNFSHQNESNAKRCLMMTGKSDQLQTPYQKLFPDFFIQNGVTLAPFNRFKSSPDALKQAQENIDRCITTPHTLDKSLMVRDILKLSVQDRLPRGQTCQSTRKIMKDFCTERSNPSQDVSSTHLIERLFKKIPMKILSFYEDVRPAYIGTYTSEPTIGSSKLARNPLSKALPDINYDYDSEAEWIEDDDGEDLHSDEEEEDIDDEDDIDGFLDDEHDLALCTREVDPNNDLVPISTGLCWENDQMQNPNTELKSLRLEFILDPNLKSINPFSTIYWTPTDPTCVPSKTISVADTKKLDGCDIVSQTSKSDGSTDLTVCASGQNSNSQNYPVIKFKNDLSIASKSKIFNSSPQPSIKLISQADMEEFKAAIVGSDLSKVGLIEVLKKRFPGRPAATIKTTLEIIARRGQKGQKEAEKRWILL